jgi:protein CpxP
MKKALLLLTVAFATIGTVHAQGGPMQRTVEERVNATMEKLADLRLDKDQTDKTKAVFTEFYEARDKMMQEMRGGGNPPDRDQMREKFQKMNTDRDEKLKKIFTEEQYKKWKDEIEPSLRPQRRGGGGGRRN